MSKEFGLIYHLLLFKIFSSLDNSFKSKSSFEIGVLSKFVPFGNLENSDLSYKSFIESHNSIPLLYKYKYIINPF